MPCLVETDRSNGHMLFIICILCILCYVVRRFEAREEEREGREEQGRKIQRRGWEFVEKANSAASKTLKIYFLLHHTTMKIMIQIHHQLILN